MRQVNGTVINEPYQIFTPFRMIISGSSGLVLKHMIVQLFLTISCFNLIKGTGKTSFCQRLLDSAVIQKKFSHIYYIYPIEIDTPPGN